MDITFATLFEQVTHHATPFLEAALTNSGTYVVLLLLSLSFYKYCKDRQIKVFCSATAANQTILQRLESRIKSYSPTFYLPFSLLKIAVYAKKTLPFLDVYRRTEMTVDDGESIHLDWYPRNYKKMEPTTPIVFYVPGVFGTSSDYYSFRFCEMIYEKLGWRSFVFNRRLFTGHFNGSKFISYTHFSDWREVLRHIKSEFPLAKIYLVGVSMGALNIQKYLGTFKEDTMVDAAVTISSPFDAQTSSDNIKNSFILNKFFHAQQLSIFRSHLHNEKFVKFMKSKGVNIRKVLDSKNNKEFDEQCSILDLELDHPDKYYEMLTSKNLIKEISVPVLSINSEDDPLIPKTNVPIQDIESNSNLIQLMVSGGGHIDYLDGWKCEFWAYNAAIDYLELMHAQKHSLSSSIDATVPCPVQAI